MAVRGWRSEIREALGLLRRIRSDPNIGQQIKQSRFFQRVAHPTEGAIWTTKPPVKFSATPARHDLRPAPRLGEHTEEILRRAGES